MSEKASLSFPGDCMLVTGNINFDSVIDLESEGERWLRQVAPQACRVDFSAVSDCNSAATALLLSWLRTAQTHEKSLQVEHLPERLQALLKLGGLGEVLNQLETIDLVTQTDLLDERKPVEMHNPQ